MKKKILSIVLVAVLALTAIGGTLAYFTDTDSADNQFTVGNVDIKLLENDLTPEGWQAWVDATHPDVVPGEVVKKEVKVENIDNEAAYVRVTVVVPTDMTATVNNNLGDWTMTMPYGENANIFVFTGKLNAGTTSPVLLQQVVINDDVTNEGKTSEYHIPVLAEAVQVTGFENDMSGAFETLATSNVKNYIDQYVANDAFKSLESGDIVTLAENTKLPETLNNGVVIIGDVNAEATKVVLGGSSAPQEDAYFLNTRGTTFVNLHFTERVAVKGDATFVNCTFDKGIWMLDVSGNVSFIGCTIEGTSSEVDLLIDGSNEGNANFGRVIVKGCTINGSSSIAGATSAIYENCIFGTEGWSWRQIRINCPTTIKGCMNADSIGNGSNWPLRVLGSKVVADSSSIDQVLADAAPGDVVVLSESITSTITVPATAKDITITAEEGVVLEQIELKAGAQNITLSGLTLDTENSTKDLIKMEKGIDYGTVTVIDCEISGVAETKSGHGISYGGANTELVVSGVTFKDIGYAIWDGWGNYSSLTVTDCTFENIHSWCIMVQATDGPDVTISDCTFKDCLEGIAKLPNIKSLEFTNNVLINCKGHDGRDTKFFEAAETATITITGCTLDGAEFTGNK